MRRRHSAGQERHLDHDVFPCHGVGGIVGMLATGILASSAVNPAGADGLFFGGTKLFTTHVLALGIVVVYAFGGSLLLYKITDLLTPLRVKEGQEAAGLDISQHGESALPWIRKTNGAGHVLSGFERSGGTGWSALHSRPPGGRRLCNVGPRRARAEQRRGGKGNETRSFRRPEKSTHVPLWHRINQRREGNGMRHFRPMAPRSSRQSLL